MIKVTGLEIRSAEGAMRKITSNPSGLEKAYWVSRLIKRLDSITNDLEKSRIKLVDTYGVKNEKGGVQVPTEKMQEFNEAFIKLLQVEIEIDMPLITFEYIKNLKFSVDDLLVLEPFVEDIGKALVSEEIPKEAIK